MLSPISWKIPALSHEPVSLVFNLMKGNIALLGQKLCTVTSSSINQFCPRQPDLHVAWTHMFSVCKVAQRLQEESSPHPFHQVFCQLFHSVTSTTRYQGIPQRTIRYWKLPKRSPGQSNIWSAPPLWIQCHHIQEAAPDLVPLYIICQAQHDLYLRAQISQHCTHIALKKKLFTGLRTTPEMSSVPLLPSYVVLLCHLVRWSSSYCAILGAHFFHVVAFCVHYLFSHFPTFGWTWFRCRIFSFCKPWK